MQGSKSLARGPGRKQFLGFVVLAVLGMPSLAQPQVSGLIGWSGSGFSGVDNNNGFEFSTSSSITITDLGFFDLSGNGLAASHEVGIWAGSNSTLLVSATVASGTAASLDGDYRYVAVAPTVLAAGDYIVSAVTTGDIYVTNLITPTMSGPLTYVSGRDTFPPETALLIYPNQPSGNQLAPANFKYDLDLDLDLVLLDAAVVAGGGGSLENAGGTLRILEPEVNASGPAVFVVPEPGFLWQLGPGAVLLGALARRRMRGARRAVSNPRAPTDAPARRSS